MVVAPATGRYRAAATLMIAVLAGCAPLATQPLDVIHPAPEWPVSHAAERPEFRRPADGTSTGGSTPVYRGQSPSFGGHGVAALPGDPNVAGHRGVVAASHSMEAARPSAVQPVQYAAPANPGPVFHAPGAGLQQPYVAAPPGQFQNQPAPIQAPVQQYVAQPIPGQAVPAFPPPGQSYVVPVGAPPPPVYYQRDEADPAWAAPPLSPLPRSPTPAWPPPQGIPPGFGPTYAEPLPDAFVDLDVLLEETQTGRLMFGVGVNSDAGLVGNLVIDEQNFDLFRWPKGFGDWSNAFRGGGQRFRLEAIPGTEVQRYSASFTEPYLYGTPVSLGLSGFFYDRRFIDWDEQRFGGRLSLGYVFPERRDLSTTVSFRYENIEIFNPAIPTPLALAEVLGDNDLFMVRWEVAHDTRDNTFLPSQGHLIRLAFEQGLGTFVFPRFEGDFRRYFVMRQRPDGSGRHVLGMAFRLGVSGKDTPIYEHFFAGGFSTIRGFDFRGASPRSPGGVILGGEFQAIASAEYRFPLTADDNLFGSFFLDAGTVEETSNVNWSNVRITPGFELRINIPALGPVPLAVGLGVPIQHAPFDDIRNFHFFVGVSR